MSVSLFDRTPRMGRGVYECPFTSTAGETILVAINHRGRRIGERVLAHGADYEQARLGMLAFLDQEDPTPVWLPRVIRGGQSRAS